MGQYNLSPSKVIYNRIKITLCDPRNGYIEGRDMYNQPIRLAYSFYYSPYIQVPKINEEWIVKKVDNNWTLYARFEDENQTVKVSDLFPGDVRVESKNILHINADQEIVINFNKAIPSLHSLNQNTLPGSALFGSGTLNQFSAGTLITTNKFITPLKTSLSTANISDGQEERYLYSSNDGTIWSFRYNSSSSSPYKWQFIGGPTYLKFVPGTVSVSGTAWGTASDLLFTIPYTGEYSFSGGALLKSNGNNGVYYIGLSVNGTVLDSIQGFADIAHRPYQTSGILKATFNKGDQVMSTERSDGSNTMSFYNRWTEIKPFRVTSI